MNFSDRPPSQKWAVLKHRGDKSAEVWFKPEGEPYVLSFRIPRQSFQSPGLGKQLTMENLLKAVAIVPEEVESWRHGGVSHSGMDGSDPGFRNALPPPPQHITYLEIEVRLKPPSNAVARDDSREMEMSAVKWQDFEARWKTILGLEATMETLRISMEGLLLEVESLWKKPLTIEEKTYAPRADVSQWNKARNRVHNALPKMKDYIHRSIWAIGSPERKRLEEFYNEAMQTHISVHRIHDALKQLEELRKDRQVLSAHGKTVFQECKAISAELQGALRALHSNAVHAQKKKAATGSKGR